jgi:hypothetical protein
MWGNLGAMIDEELARLVPANPLTWREPLASNVFRAALVVSGAL